jgi:hypothetical protein
VPRCAGCWPRCPTWPAWSSSPSCSHARCPATRRPTSPAARPRRRRWTRCAAARPGPSLPEQFLHYVAAWLRGDFGQSLTTGQPVLQELVARLPASIELVLLALCWLRGGAAAGRGGRQPAGLVGRPAVPRSSPPPACRCRPSSPACCCPTSSTSCSAGRRRRWAGWTRCSRPRHRSAGCTWWTRCWSATCLWWACFKQLVLPTVTMALFVLAPIARMTRASMLQVLSSDFVRTARASGLRHHRARALRAAQRAAAGGHHAGHGVRLHAGLERDRREGLRLAGRRQLRDRRADRQRLRTGAGLRAGDGRAVRAAEPGASTCCTR